MTVASKRLISLGMMQSAPVAPSMSDRIQRIKDISFQKEVLRDVTAAEFAMVVVGGRSAEVNATASTSDTSKGACQPFKWGVKIKTEGDTESKAGSSKEVGGDRGDEWTKKKKEGGPGEKKKANFGLTGALAKDESSGNLRNGVVLKYSAALDAGVPPHVWRLYVFNGPELEETLYIHRQPSYLIGKDRRVSDIILGHSSCSKQHAVIVFRNVEL